VYPLDVVFYRQLAFEGTAASLEGTRVYLLGVGLLLMSSKARSRREPFPATFGLALVELQVTIYKCSEVFTWLVAERKSAERRIALREVILALLGIVVAACPALPRAVKQAVHRGCILEKTVPQSQIIPQAQRSISSGRHAISVKVLRGSH
jgi:hypothetical protein